MAQAFVTTTIDSYRYISQEVRRPMRQERYYPECYKKDYWYEVKEIKFDDDFHKVELAVKNLLIKRADTTTYREHYCRDWKPPVIGEDESEKPKHTQELQLIDTFRPLYQRDDDKVKLLQPIQTSRNIYGYLPKSDIFIPRSTFQDSHGVLGFKFLEEAQERSDAKKVHAKNDA